MRKVKEMLHHHQTPATTPTTSGFANPGSATYIHPLVQQQTSLPPHISTWTPGQPVPQGWRLGRKGYLKPIWTLPPHLAAWQPGQPIPEGYRLSKRGTLRPINYTWVTTTTTTSVPLRETGIATTSVLPAEVEVREKPAVVQEVIRPGIREEVQPVIHRDREQLEIREEIQPIYEKSVRGTIVEERQLAPEVRPEIRLGQMPILAEGPRGGVVVEAEKREMLVHAPIVEETVHKKIVEEVQPVIHREVIAPRVIHETKNIYEKVVEAPTVSYTTLPPRFVNEQFTSSGFGGWQPGQSLPPHILGWQQGQPIPQGWRLGRKGYLKPMYSLPPHLSTWQRGQPIPEGYRVGKSGMLKPTYLYNFGNYYPTSKFQQQGQSSFLPNPVQRF